MSPESSTRGAASPLRGLGAAPFARLRRVFILAVSVGASVWIWQWVSTDETGAPVTDTPGGNSMEIEHLKSFLVRRDGLPLWELNAKRVTLAADGSSTTATGIGRGTLYREGKPFLNIQAPHLRLANATNNLEATGGVSATGPDGFSFQTARALWNNASRVVNCPKPVEARLKNLWFETPNLFYQWEKGVLTCPKPVEVRTEGAVFRANNLKAQLKTRQLQFDGGVELIFKPSSVGVSLPR